MEDRFRALQDTLRLPLGAKEALVYSPLGGDPQIVTEAELALVARCAEFATLHEHAARLDGPMVSPTTRHGGSVRSLRQLVDRGLLVSERALTAAVRAAPSGDEGPTEIASVGIPSGRPELAAEAVASIARGRAGRPLEVVIADDGADAALCRSMIEAVSAKAASDPGLRLRYLGPSEREAQAGLLAARAGVAPELVRWALTRQHPGSWSAGALRNALMLDVIGAPALQIDDDIRWEVALPPIVEPGLALCSAGSVMELWFPAPERDGATLVALAPGDVARLHERLLGRSLGACVRDAAALELSDASGAFLQHAIEGRGRVSCTQMGLCGDAATGTLGHYLLLQGRSRERLVVSEPIYEHAFASRQGVRATRKDGISDGAFCMSYALGLDGRVLLPPFMPEGRNGDGVFGHVLRRALRDHLFGFVPEVVAHQPPPRASSVEDLLAQLEGIDANDLVCRIIAATPLTPGDGASGLEVLGGHLENLGGLSVAALEETVRGLVLRTRSRDISLLRHTLASHHHRPPYWARDVGRLVERLKQAVLRAEHAHPRDLMRLHGDERGRRALGEVLLSYGRLLRAWPRLDRAARELAAAGVRASRPWPELR